MNKAVNLQDLLLNHARRENIPVTVFLTSGFQMKGVIRGYDSYVILLESDGKQQMIYKHAISTIVPFRAIKLNFAEETE
jgi:host factor-I protein